MIQAGEHTRFQPWVVALGFLLLCHWQAPVMSLWGDEAFSLDLAEMPWARVLHTADVHLPTYYLLLKGALALVGAGRETLLRMIHAVPVALGLVVGHRTLLRITGSRRAAGLGLVAAALLPDLAFYATNLRMYALLFLAEMAFIDRVSVLCLDAGPLDRRRLAPLLLAGLLLVQLDLTGLPVFAAGMLALWAFRPALGLPRLACLALLPLLGLAVHAPILADYLPLLDRFRSGPLAPLLAPGLDRPPVASPATAARDAIVAHGYATLRPILALGCARGGNPVLALGLPAAIAAWLGVRLLRRARGSRADQLLAYWCLAWLPLTLAGLAQPRLCLASMFFLAAELAAPLPAPGRAPAARLAVVAAPAPSPGSRREAPGAAGIAFLATYLLGSLAYAVRPALGLASRIPYRQVAGDACALARREGIGVVLLTAHHGGARSVDRYLRAEAACPLRRVWLLPGAHPSDLPRDAFLAVSFMAERGWFVDLAEALHGSSPRRLEPVRGYLPLDDLPMNEPFRRHVTRDARQGHAAILYRVAGDPGEHAAQPLDRTARWAHAAPAAHPPVVR